MLYAAYNSTGNITGFYNDEIHLSIPILAREITDAEWKDCVENQGLRKINVATKEIIKLSVPLPQPIITPKQVALDKLSTTTTILQIKAVLLEYFKS